MLDTSAECHEDSIDSGAATGTHVEFVLKLLGDGYTADDIVSEYPELERHDVFQAAKYGAWLASERTSAVA